MDDESAQKAWVVSYRQSYSPGLFSTAFVTEARANEFAAKAKDHGAAVASIRQEIDLAPTDVYARFVEHLGVETSPGVISIGWGEYRGVEVVVDPRWISQRIQKRDDFDDNDFPRSGPKAIHPRRLALEYLLFYLFDELLPSAGEVPRRVHFGRVN